MLVDPRLVLVLVPVLLLAGCAAPIDPQPGPRADTGPGIQIQAHVFEVPRNPAPAYHADGVAIVSLDGASSWARAGLRAGDVIEGVNGEAVRKPEEFAALTGGREPLEVRILRSRAGVYGTVLVEVAIRRAD